MVKQSCWIGGEGWGFGEVDEMYDLRNEVALTSQAKLPFPAKRELSPVAYRSFFFIGNRVGYHY